jgi:hypothetical protein
VDPGTWSEDDREVATFGINGLYQLGVGPVGGLVGLCPRWDS